jgi:sortase A
LELPPIPTAVPAGVSGEGVSREAPPKTGNLRPARALEVAAWGLGAILMLLWAGSRIHSTAAARTGVRQFEKARARTILAGAPARVAPVGSVAPSGSIDFGLWSPERIDAFLAAGGGQAEPLGVLRIPRVGIEAPLYDGTDDATLDRGVGRIDGTARPGERGNLGIAGHRDGFFRGLKDLACGDRIELATVSRSSAYRVDEIRIVDPDNVDVLDATPEASLTLVTCYPFYYVGSAPHRYIVRAVLENPPDKK